MIYPPLLTLPTENEYRFLFETTYCKNILCTFDGIRVRFRKHLFNHCFYESSRHNDIKDCFSRPRAERIEWIRIALQDSNSDLYVGWDKKRRIYDRSRRVAIVMNDYAVVIRFTNGINAEFVTAYLVDTPTSLNKIKTSPRYIK